MDANEWQEPTSTNITHAYKLQHHLPEQVDKIRCICIDRK